MIRLCLGLIFGLWTSSALAQDLPALFDVTGVAADDILNIRAEPDAGSPVLSTLAPNATSVEAVEMSADGNWLRVGSGESSGWAAARFLERQPGQDMALLSRSLGCSGTEPFWSVDLPGDGPLIFEEMGQAPTTGPIAVAASVNRTDKEGFLARLTGDLLVTGVLTRGLCSDGMSDRIYGISLDLIVNGPGGDALFSGCCSLR